MDASVLTFPTLFEWRYADSLGEDVWVEVTATSSLRAATWVAETIFSDEDEPEEIQVRLKGSDVIETFIIEPNTTFTAKRKPS